MLQKKASQNSQLPGRTNGPADAYRHLIWAGELTRRYGEIVAGQWVALHETSIYKKPSLDEKEHSMDNHNNLIGMQIGKQAKNWEEVKEIAKNKIMQSDGKEGNAGKPVWLDEVHWYSNPTRIDPLTQKSLPIPTHELKWPDPSWRNEDKKPSHENEEYPYGDMKHRHPSHRNTDVKPLTVREELEKNYRVEEQKAKVANQNAANSNAPFIKDGKISSGGTVNVKAYDREGGTEHVRSHTRRPPDK